MFKSYIVHAKNKYPNCQVRASESSMDVYSMDGIHLIHLERNAFGQIIDKSEEFGCEDVWDLSPIPKESRVYKLYADGKIGLSEEAEERKAYVSEMGWDKVPSIKELA